jgi:predicted metal-binding membrane protein
MASATQQRVFVPFFLLLVACAWLALWAWEASPYGAYLHHGLWTQIGAIQTTCSVTTSIGDGLIQALTYIGGWVLMTAAMMLPTTLPLLDGFRRMTLRRKDHNALLSLVIGGYLVAWMVFGIAAHGIDWLLRKFFADNIWLALNGWVVGVIVLALAGAFQFSSIKYRCLDKCRAPLGFITRHWTGDAYKRQSLLLGLEHGLYCVGCCWALMLLMFVVGTGGIGWMLLLAAVMAAEKNLPFGRRLSAPLGALLIAGASAVAFYHIGSLNSLALLDQATAGEAVGHG